MDMSVAYRSAVSIHLPKAKIVFDHFHVINLFNEKLSELRRALYREATEVMHKQVLKGTRWLLLKNPENLDAAKNEKQRLEEALALNKPLATAYYMKDELRRFWEQPGKQFATAFLDGWIRRAEASGIKVLQQMGKTLAAYRSGLLAYYDAMITSGPMEGTNNKIKTMKRQAYGFRDQEFFKLKILAIHETKYALIG
jgi:transposase